MNKELIVILVSISNLNEDTKGAICIVLSKRLCRVNCNVCPFGYTHVTINGSPHYLKHLIALMDRGNI